MPLHPDSPAFIQHLKQMIRPLICGCGCIAKSRSSDSGLESIVANGVPEGEA